MADNKQAGAAVGVGPTFATDEIAGIDYPRSKVVWGVDGVAVDASASNPLPVVQTGTPALPAGAATETTLAAASAKLPATLGQKTMAAALAVSIASDQSAVPMSDNGGSVTVDSAQLPTTLGQKAMAASMAVVLASDQSTLPVSAASLPLPTGAATEATLAALNTKAAADKTSDYDTGAGTDTVPMVGIALPASGGAVQGGTATNPIRIDPVGTTPQPITDNGGSVTTDTPQLPSTLGQKTMANSVGVAIASDQGNVPANIAQINGVAPLMGNGASGTGAQRVTIANDSTGQVALAAGASEIGLVKNSGTFAVQAAGTVASGSADSGNPLKVGGKYNATPPTIADGQRADLQMDANGNVKVAIASGGGSGGTASSFGSAVPATGTAAGASDGTNMQIPRVFDLDSGAGTQYGLGVNLRKIASGGSVEAGTSSDPLRTDPTGTTAQPITDNGGSVTTDTPQLPASLGQKTMANSVGVAIASDQGNLPANVAQINGVTPLMGAGVTGTGSQRVTIATDGQGQVADNAGFTDGTTRLDVAGFIFDETAGTALTENDAAAARIDSKRAIVNVLEDATTRGQRAAVSASGALSVTDVPATSGGWSISTLLSAATTNATSVKASAGQVGGWYLYNANAAVRYLKLYNKASAPTVGTDVPVMTIPIPPGSGANVEIGKGLPFATGIAFAITTGPTTADTGAVAANEIIVNLYYK
jgi:hypothetical protein